MIMYITCETFTHKTYCLTYLVKMIGVFLVFLVVLYLTYHIISRQHPKNFPPGPRLPVPLLGDAYQLGTDIPKGLHELTVKHGSIFGFWMGPERAIAISDFDVLQEVLNWNETTNRQRVNLDVLRLARRGDIHGAIPGVIFSSGNNWSEIRRSSLHILRDFGYGKNALEEIIEEEVDNLIEHIEQNCLDMPMDVNRFFNIIVLSSLWRLLSGESLKIGDPKLENLIDNMRKLVKDSANPILIVSFSSELLFKFVHKVGLTSFTKTMHMILDYCNEYIEIQKTKLIDGENPLTFIEAFLHKINSVKDPSEPLHGENGILNLQNMLFDFFLAGGDTTANTLNWAMLHMILNPEMQDKVRQELKSSLGFRKAKMVDKTDTPYTEAVLHEIQRKGNIAPFGVLHRTTQDIKIGDFDIPKDTAIFPLLGEIMHDPAHFPEPNKFDPERYMSMQQDGTLKFTPDPRVIPFGTGKRRCLGETLARMTLYKFFTTLIQKFEIVSGQDVPILDQYTPGAVLTPSPYKLKFVKIK